ncbi:hypothetical protein Agub_g11525, partial [Astrephomene gubernaculifera]
MTAAMAKVKSSTADEAKGTQRRGARIKSSPQGIPTDDAVAIGDPATSSGQKASAPKGASRRGKKGSAASVTPTIASGSAAGTHSGPWFTEQQREEYRRELLHWYDHSHRVLPWRRTPHSKKHLLNSSGSSAETSAADAGAAAATGAAAGAAAGAADAGAAPPDLPPQQFAYWVWVSEVMLQQTQV